MADCEGNKAYAAAIRGVARGTSEFPVKSSPFFRCVHNLWHSCCIFKVWEHLKFRRMHIVWRRGVPKSGNPARQSRPRPVACYRKVRLTLATPALSLFLSFPLSLSLWAWLKVLKNFSNFREPKKVQVAFYCVKNVRFHKGLCTIRSPTQQHTHTHTSSDYRQQPRPSRISLFFTLLTSERCN